MKQSKRFLSILIILLLCISLSACGEKPKQTTNNQETQQGNQITDDSQNNSDTNNSGTDSQTDPNTSGSDDSSNSDQKSPTGNKDSSFNADDSKTPGGNPANISPTPSEDNQKTDDDAISKAKNAADVVYREFIVNYIEGNASGVFGTLSRPAIDNMKESYGAQYNKTASEISDTQLKLYLMGTFSTFPESGYYSYTVTCSIGKYFLKDSYEYIDYDINYFNGDEETVKAFAEIAFKVESGGKILSEKTGIAVLVNDSWQVLTTKLDLPI